MEGLIPCIYRAMARHSSSHQILSRSSSSRKNLLSSADQHSSSGRSFGREHLAKYYATRLPTTGDSGQLADIAPQDCQVKSPDQIFPSIAQSLHRRAGKQSLVNHRSEFQLPNSFHYRQ